MMPYAFAAMTMKSVGKVANDVVKECLEQFPKIMSPEKMKPDYERCIRISTGLAAGVDCAGCPRDPQPCCKRVEYRDIEAQNEKTLAFTAFKNPCPSRTKSR